MKRILCVAVLGLVAFVAAGAHAEQKGAPAPVAGPAPFARPMMARAAAPRPAAAPRVAYRRLSDVAATKPGVWSRAVPGADIQHIFNVKQSIGGWVTSGERLEHANDFIGAARTFAHGATEHTELAEFFKLKGVEAFRAGNKEVAGNFFAHALHAYADAADTRLKQSDAARFGKQREMEGEAIASAKAALNQANVLLKKLGWDSKHPTADRITVANTRLRDAAYAFRNPVVWH
jgi:hypothetical protein